jgi:hypothetical protein
MIGCLRPNKIELTVHGNATNDVLTQVLGNLQHKLLSILLGVKGVENGGEFLGVKFLCVPQNQISCVDVFFFFFSMFRFRFGNEFPRQNFSSYRTYHVDDGTNDLVNLAGPESLRRHGASTEGRDHRLGQLEGIAERPGGSQRGGTDSPSRSKSSNPATNRRSRRQYSIHRVKFVTVRQMFHTS